MPQALKPIIAKRLKLTFTKAQGEDENEIKIHERAHELVDLVFRASEPSDLGKVPALSENHELQMQILVDFENANSRT